MIWIGSILSWFLVIPSGLKIVFGLLVIYGDNDPAFFTHYFGNAPLGQQLDKAFMILAAGVVIGLLAKIAKKVSQEAES